MKTQKIIKNVFLVTITYMVTYTLNCNAQIYTKTGKRYYSVFNIDFTLENDKLNNEQAQIILRNVENCYNNNNINNHLISLWNELEDIYNGNLQGTIYLKTIKTYLNIVFEDFFKKEIYNYKYKPNKPEFKYFHFKVSELCALDGLIYADFYAYLQNSDRYRERHGAYGSHIYFRYIDKFPKKVKWGIISGLSSTEYDPTISIYDLYNNAYREAVNKSNDPKFINKAISKSAEMSSNSLYDLFNHVYSRVPQNDPIFTNGQWDNTIINMLSITDNINKIYGEKVFKKYANQLAIELFPLIFLDNKKTDFINKCKSLGINTTKINLSNSNKYF